MEEVDWKRRDSVTSRQSADEPVVEWNDASTWRLDSHVVVPLSRSTSDGSQLATVKDSSAGVEFV